MVMMVFEALTLLSPPQYCCTFLWDFEVPPSPLISPLVRWLPRMWVPFLFCSSLLRVLVPSWFLFLSLSLSLFFFLCCRFLMAKIPRVLRIVLVTYDLIYENKLLLCVLMYFKPLMEYLIHSKDSINISFNDKNYISHIFMEIFNLRFILEFIS